MRRYGQLGRLPMEWDGSHRRVVDGVGVALAEFARETMKPPPDSSRADCSARNRMVGLVTGVHVDGVMAQVEMQCGPIGWCR